MLYLIIAIKQGGTLQSVTMSIAYSNEAGRNRLLGLIMGILLVAASFYTLSMGAIKPNPQYSQWLMDKQQFTRSGGATNKTPVASNDRPPRTRYKITPFEAVTILITLPIGVVLIIGSIRPGLIGMWSQRTSSNTAPRNS